MVQAPTKPPPISEPAFNADLVDAPPIILRLPPQWAVDDDCLSELGALNELLWIERTAEGALQIGFPTGFHTAKHEVDIGRQIANWRFAIHRGEVTGTNSAYSLPDGSLLMPDAAWISDERLEGIEIGPTKPMPAVPDFVLEVRSFSQDIKDQQDKMEQWMANGVRLGWLIDLFEAQVWIYRAGQDEPELLERPDTLSGEDVMVGLTVDLTRIWPTDSN